MTIFIVVAIVVFLLWFTYPKDEQGKKAPCKLHKWEYYTPEGMDSEWIICKECNRTPSQILHESGSDD